MMSPTGPSPFWNGNFASISSACMIAGRLNARVLPEPVNAMPIMSLPENLSVRCCQDLRADNLRCRKSLHLNRGRALDAFRLEIVEYRFWDFHVLPISPYPTPDGSRHTVKLVIGGGIRSPSDMI
jgi:hypothetical protein